MVNEIYVRAMELRRNLGPSRDHLRLFYGDNPEQEDLYGFAVDYSPINEIWSRAMQFGKENCDKELSEKYILDNMSQKAKRICSNNEDFRKRLVEIVMDNAELTRLDKIAKENRIDIWK